MSLTAKFVADFTNFYDACAKAEVHLLTFQSSATSVEKALNRMVTSFSGEQIIRQATLAAEAVERLGGASKLTADEQTRVNAIMTQAISKMQAVGVDVPQKFRDLASATSSWGNALSFVESSLGKIGIVLSAGAVLNFAANAVEATSRLVDLSKATGITYDGLQRLQFVGQGFGVDLETIARGVEQFSAKLATGDASATKAVGMLGLSVKDLLAAGPEEAFLRFADAAGRVEDPMLKTGVATDALGGRIAKTLLPALADLRKALADVPKTAIIDDKNVESVKAFDDGWKHLVTTVKAWTADAIGTIAQLRQQRVAWDDTTQSVKFYSEALDQVSVKGHDVVLPKDITAAELFANRLTQLKAGFQALTPAQQESALEWRKLGATIQEIVGVFNNQLSEGAIKTFFEDFDKQTANALEEWSNYNEELRREDTQTFELAQGPYEAVARRAEQAAAAHQCQRPRRTRRAGAD
jgi:hypothetical protein